ncbi:MAG TPA: metalloregulator ArsR/SmtB family transcription factor [Pirellulaceae bacterium]|jgi:ArsR family transcriptional regulator, arsenate/arsenite/antimonite-responsive transcriptional repressor|nr:metalloregulator ArsR/SmtB family transcription factor [Pirellulaceae bacterium]
MITTFLPTMFTDDPEAAPPAARKARADDASKLAPLPDAVARDLVQLFKLLADETRVRILHYLMQRDELNVRSLCELLGQSQPAVSHHLALMRVAGLIECRRDGKHNFYHLVPKRAQQYLDLLFGADGKETRRVRVENATVTYSCDAG